METLHVRTVDSPVGPLTLAGKDGRLRHLRMVDQTYEPSREGWTRDDDALADAVDQLEAYFAGELLEFDLDLELVGSEFQRRVWAALLTIPYGETRSYGQVAAQIGSPTASRAVLTRYSSYFRFTRPKGRQPSLIARKPRAICSCNFSASWGGSSNNIDA